MGNNKIVKTAAAVALGASVVATAAAPGAASAATTYKVKSGKLYQVKENGKTALVKGFKTYDKILYKDGKKYKGLRGGKFYSAGKLASGSFKGVRYQKGLKFTGVSKADGKFYKNGVVGTGTYKNVKYKKGLPFTGVSTADKKYYVNGKVATGSVLVDGVLYVDGVQPTGLTQFEDTYYNNGTIANGEFEVDGTKVEIKDGKIVATATLKIASAEATAYNTVEVKLDKAFTGEVAAADFKVEGLEVTAAALNEAKDAVVLTTATQEAGKEYTVTYKEEAENKATFVGKAAPAKAESATAINATDATFTVTLDKEVAEADLKDAKVALAGAQNLTASFVKVEGKVATFKVDQDILNKAAYDGEYALTSAAFASDLKTTYSAVIAGTFVEGFVFTDNAKATAKVALAGATVSVDGKSVVTDANGYYQIAVNPGVKTVEVSKGNDYFVSTSENAEVARNNSTVVNTDLSAIDPTELYFTGTVLDSKDSKAVADAEVKLQAKNDKGEWETVSGYTVETDAAGKFVFANSSANVTSTTDTDAIKKSVSAKNDKLVVGNEYRAVVEKKVTATNLDDVYKQQTVSFVVSNKQKETTKLVTAEKVAELQELKIDASVIGKAVLQNSTSVTFLNTDGEETLEEFNLVKGTDVTFADDDTKAFKEAVDVVADKAKFANGSNAQTVKPRLISGTYFMVVSDNTNATKAYAVEVTEGGKASVKFETEVAKTAQAKTLVDKVQFDKALYANPNSDSAYQTSGDLQLTEINADLTRSSDNIQAQYTAYQTVAGKDIAIATTAAKDVKAAFDSTGVTSITAEDAALNFLAGSVTYKVKSTSDFLVGNKELTVKPDAATNNVTATVDAATKLNSIELKDKSTGNAITSEVTVKSLKLVNDEGKTVAEVTTDATVTPNAQGIVTLAELDTVTGEEIAAQFANIKADKYKLTVELEGYSAGTSLESDLIDFQNGQISVSLAPYVGTKVTGYVRYAANGENVADADADAEATIIAYDKNGDAQAAVDFGKVAGETTYELTGLKAGEEYTFVVRGADFETQAVKKTVVNGDITSLNFDVVKGANGQFKLQIVDQENNDVDNSKVAYIAKDAYFDKDNGASDDTNASLPTVAFDGDYAVQTPAANATGTDKRTFVIDGVSAGAYTLELSEGATTNDKYVLPQAYNLTLKDINGTSYATSNGTEIIKVPLLNGSTGTLDVALNLKVTGTAVESAAKTPADIDYIQVLDKDGNIVATKRAGSFIQSTNDEVSIKVPNNATYTVKAYLNNGFVVTDTLTVQNNDVSKTIYVTEAQR